MESVSSTQKSFQYVRTRVRFRRVVHRIPALGFSLPCAPKVVHQKAIVLGCQQTNLVQEQQGWQLTWYRRTFSLICYWTLQALNRKLGSLTKYWVIYVIVRRRTHWVRVQWNFPLQLELVFRTYLICSAILIRWDFIPSVILLLCGSPSSAGATVLS